MYRDHAVVVVVPAQRHAAELDLLLAQLAGYAVVDEVRVWLDPAWLDPAWLDPAWLDPADPQFPSRVIRVDSESQLVDTVDRPTVLVRFSRDVVLLDTPDAFEAFLDFRIDHPEHFAVVATTLNTSIVTHIQQRLMHIDALRGMAEYARNGTMGHTCWMLAENVHFHIQSHVNTRADLARYRVSHPWILFDRELVKLDCVAWLVDAGTDTTRYLDEAYVCTHRPRELGQLNCVFGGYVCVHFASRHQRAHLEWTGMLRGYEAIAAAEPKAEPTTEPTAEPAEPKES